MVAGSLVLLDINSPTFQTQWFGLPKDDRLAAIATMVKLRKMTWEEVYRDKGLRWELIRSRSEHDGSKIYSLRITRKIRAVARREGNLLKFLSIHPDHDSAYQ